MATLNTNLFNFLENKLDIKDNFFLYKLPAAKKTETKVWWLVPVSDSLSRKLTTFEKDYLLTYELNYRSDRPSDVDEKIEKAKTKINNIKCFNLPNYKAISISCTSSSSTDDIDAENAQRGSLVISLRVIKGNE